MGYGAVVARITEPRIYRELASEHDCPIGLKYNTDGCMATAINAIKFTSSSHHFFLILQKELLLMCKSSNDIVLYGKFLQSSLMRFMY